MDHIVRYYSSVIVMGEFNSDLLGPFTHDKDFFNYYVRSTPVI